MDSDWKVQKERQPRAFLHRQEGVSDHGGVGATSGGGREAGGLPGGRGGGRGGSAEGPPPADEPEGEGGRAERDNRREGQQPAPLPALLLQHGGGALPGGGRRGL